VFWLLANVQEVEGFLESMLERPGDIYVSQKVRYTWKGEISDFKSEDRLANGLDVG